MAEPDIAVVFLARGRHEKFAEAFRRFVHSYKTHDAGIGHRLYVVFKGFDTVAHRLAGERAFAGVPHVPLHLPDDGFDIGAYKRAAALIPERLVCFVNTKTEILADLWLQKLVGVLSQPGVGLTGATGSFFSHRVWLPAFPPFPNIHIRTNTFLVDRQMFTTIADSFNFQTKFDGWMFESGPNSLTRQVLRAGLRVLVVGSDGQGYEPWQWPACGTFRSLTNANALIADDDFRGDQLMDPPARSAKCREFWRNYLDPGQTDEIRALIDRWRSESPLVHAVVTGGGAPRRNDPCPCGSGVRFKNCHGSLLPEVKALVGG